MCNLYSMTRNVDAIRRLFKVDPEQDRTGNMPPLPGIYPDYPAPIVRNSSGGRELAMARWGMPWSQRALMDATKSNPLTSPSPPRNWARTEPIFSSPALRPPACLAFPAAGYRHSADSITTMSRFSVFDTQADSCASQRIVTRTAPAQSVSGTPLVSGPNQIATRPKTKKADVEAAAAGTDPMVPTSVPATSGPIAVALRAAFQQKP